MACVVLVLVRTEVLGVLIVYCKRVGGCAGGPSGPVSEVLRTSEVAVVYRRQVPPKVAGRQADKRVGTNGLNPTSIGVL